MAAFLPPRVNSLLGKALAAFFCSLVGVPPAPTLCIAGKLIHLAPWAIGEETILLEESLLLSLKSMLREGYYIYAMCGIVSVTPSRTPPNHFQYFK